MAIHAFLSLQWAGIPLAGWFALSCCLMMLAGFVVSFGGIRLMREHKSYQFSVAYASDGSVVKSRATSISGLYYYGRQTVWRGIWIALSAGIGLGGFLSLW